jgi:hypothetical protein
MVHLLALFSFTSARFYRLTQIKQRKSFEKREGDDIDQGNKKQIEEQHDDKFLLVLLGIERMDIESVFHGQGKHQEIDDKIGSEVYGADHRHKYPWKEIGKVKSIEQSHSVGFFLIDFIQIVWHLRSDMDNG